MYSKVTRVKSTLTETDKEIKFLMKTFDKSGNGLISTEELQAAMTSATGSEMDIAQAAAALAKYDKEHSGSLDLNQFTAWYKDIQAEQASKRVPDEGRCRRCKVRGCA